MEIERIDDYCDNRFDSEILRQHGAFLIDGRYPCGFRISGSDSAVIYYHDYSDVDELIENFRFFAGHISRFYDKNGKLIREFPGVKLFDLEIDRIQPSQFYADTDKLAAVASFVYSGEDVVIPVVPWEGGYISGDGHTRLVCAYRKGIRRVRAFLSAESDDYIMDFAGMARERGVYSVKDIKELSHEEYNVKWNKFCEEYFKPG